MTILTVEQDTARAPEVVHRALVIQNGREALPGSPAEFDNSVVLRDAVFGS